jgi:hypothetical protein
MANCVVHDNVYIYIMDKKIENDSEIVHVIPSCVLFLWSTY